jgi:membrane protein DedA with SNARE-associated domain
VEWLTVYLEQFTYVGIALSLFVAGLGVPIPEDIPLIFGGAMAGAGKINVWVHFGLSMAFILIGDACLYGIGRRLGNASEQKGFFGKLLTPQRRAAAGRYYVRFGDWTVFFGRFIAGVRGAIFLTAGVVKFPFWRFVLLDFLAALISVPVWIYLGWYFGENWEVIIESVKDAQGWVIGGALFAVLLVIIAVKLAKRRQRDEAELATELRHTADAAEHAAERLKSDSSPPVPPP